jgi:DNA repair protein SbcC/Rad50
MLPIEQTLHKFKGIRDGLGTDTLKLNFTGLQGLVGISGPNGCGKTTVIETMHPYAQLASRKGTLASHVYGRDAYKELVVLHEGHKYRYLHKIDAQSGRQEGFIWKGEVPVVDGKISSYKRYVENQYGSPKLFFASVFCAQNADGLDDMTTGELKSLMTEFLRLDRYVQWEDTAKRCIAVLGGRISGFDSELATINGDLISANDTKEDLIHAKVNMEQYRADLENTETDITIIRDKLEKAQANQQAQEVLAQELKGLDSSINQLTEDITADETAKEKELAGLRVKFRGVNDDIEYANSLLADKDAVEAAVRRATELTTAINEKTLARDETRKKLDVATEAHRDLENQLSNMKIAHTEAHGTFRGKVNRLVIEKNNLADKTAALDLRDPACASTTCRFITDALAAKEALPGVTADLATAENDLQQMEAAHAKSIEKLSNQITVSSSTVTDLKTSSTGINNELAALLTGQLAANELAAKAPGLETAKARLEELGKQKATLTKDGMTIKGNWDARLDKKNGQLTALQIKHSKIIIDDRTEIMVIGYKDQLERREAHKTTIDSKRVTTHEQITALERDAARFNILESRKKNLTADRDTLANEMAQWARIKADCGKDGLRALEIDCVAPAITSFGNRLLHSTFGPMYSVKFQTIDPETGREVLNILVIKEDGTEVLLENLSGGQRVWVLKALRLAMTLLSKERSGCNFLSFMADEEDGALDIKNARQFVELYRSAMVEGGFERCIFISHKPECVAMADHVIELGHGGATIH